MPIQKVVWPSYFIREPANKKSSSKSNLAKENFAGGR